MKRHDLRLEAAKQASDAQRQRLHDSFIATRTRLLPSRLKFDATQAVEQRISDTAKLGVDQVKAHPLLAGLGVAAFIAWLFRAPLIEHGPDKARDTWAWLAGKAGLTHVDLGGDAPDADQLDDTTPPPKPVPPPPPPPGDQQY